MGLCLPVLQGLAQTPKVTFPNKKKETTTEEREAATNSIYRMSARPKKEVEPTLPDKVAKARPVPQPGPKPEFPPGAVSLGVVDVDSGASLPDNLKPFAKEGAIAMAGGDFEKARASYERMVALAPNNELARANLGMAEYRLQNYPAAREQFSSAVRINPKVAQNWVTLGLVHYREGNLELAISSLTHGISLNQEDARAHQYLAVVVSDYGWPDAAVKELQRAIQLDPSYTDAHFNLAVQYLKQSPPAFELARRHYYTAIDLGAKPDPRIEKEIKAAEMKASQSTN